MVGEGGSAGVVLVLDEDRASRDLVVSVLARNGYDVVAAANAAEAQTLIENYAPDLVISDATTKNREIIGFLHSLRADAKTNAVPFILLAAFGETEDFIDGFDPESDGSIVKPVRPPELVARVGAAFARVSTLAEVRSSPRRLTILSDHAFEAECKSDFEAALRDELPASFAYVELFELPGILETVGQRGDDSISRQVALLMQSFASIAHVGRDVDGRFMVYVNAPGATTRALLNDLSLAIVGHRFHVGTEPIRLTPIVGFATRTGLRTFAEMRRRASFAVDDASSHLDLQAVRYHPRLERIAVDGAGASFSEKIRAFIDPVAIPLQIIATFICALVVPFFGYWLLWANGFDVTNVIYIVFVVVLLLTALAILTESFLAVKRLEPPAASAYPPASAVIAAYLPNEAATIIETIEAFLRVDYPGDLQVILAYNTPRAMPMEEELRAIADRDPRFMPLRVESSTSKAQNVNAALPLVRGNFVGVFDADHKPDPDSFTRAWNWLAYGYDIVQGHCLIRNGADSFVAQLVAVEFESIYAVSHPGRTRLHGFGLFGGSNGYWKTDLIRQTRMHRFMLTEDIDSSLRVIEAGYRIATDPKIISRELAPLTLRAFWHQRLRWAQGWFQVSLKHLVPALRSPHLSIHQKAGILHLLLWRECYAWICIQLIPVLAFWIFVRKDTLSFFVPIFVVTTIVTTIVGPLQTLFTYALTVPEMRAKRGWFGTYLVASFVFFSELKNVISRLAHFKEAARSRAWKVTPRSTTVTPL